jgi:hypothetical protein
MDESLKFILNMHYLKASLGLTDSKTLSTKQ